MALATASRRPLPTEVMTLRWPFMSSVTVAVMPLACAMNFGDRTGVVFREDSQRCGAPRSLLWCGGRFDLRGNGPRRRPGGWVVLGHPSSMGGPPRPRPPPGGCGRPPSPLIAQRLPHLGGQVVAVVLLQHGADATLAALAVDADDVGVVRCGRCRGGPPGCRGRSAVVAFSLRSAIPLRWRPDGCPEKAQRPATGIKSALSRTSGDTRS